jgi:hypothetical protein
VLTEIFSLPSNGGHDDGAVNYQMDEGRENKATRSKRPFLLLGPNSRRVLTVPLSLLVSDSPLAMPSEVELYSKS